MVRAHGTVVLIRHIHLVVFFLVALHARVVWAAPLQAQGGDEGGSNDYPVSRLDVGLEPLGHPGDPLKVNSFSTSSPIPVLQPESNLTPVPVGEGDAASQLASRLREMAWADQEAMKKEVFPEGSNDSLPVRDEEREVMRATGMLGSSLQPREPSWEPAVTLAPQRARPNASSHCSHTPMAPGAPQTVPSQPAADVEPAQHPPTPMASPPSGLAGLALRQGLKATPPG